MKKSHYKTQTARSCVGQLCCLLLTYHPNNMRNACQGRPPVGLVVKASASRAEGPGIFPGSSHTSDLKIGTPVTALPGAWRYSVSAGAGWPGVSILLLDKIESWICNFYLSVAARKIVWADPSLRYTRVLRGRSATNKTNKSLGRAGSDACICYHTVVEATAQTCYLTQSQHIGIRQDSLALARGWEWICMCVRARMRARVS